MTKTSIVMLSDTEGEVNVTGDPVRADAWYGLTDGLHTIAVYFQNFRGRFFIEGTLSNDPQEDEWFPIYLDGEVPYLEYSASDSDEHNVPANLSSEHKGKSGVEAFTFQGNFLYLRARVDRSYMQPEPEDHIAINQLGVVKKVLLSH